MQLRSYECNVKGADWSRYVHATSAGKARYQYWLDVSDPWPDVKITDITVRSCRQIMRNVTKLPGGGEYCKVEHTAKHRGLNVKEGSVVRWEGNCGWIVDSNGSANFRVLMSEGPNAGHEVVIHPSEFEVVEA